MADVIPPKEGEKTSEGYKSMEGIQPIKRLIKKLRSKGMPEAEEKKEDEGDMKKWVDKRDEEIKKKETPRSYPEPKKKDYRDKSETKFD